MLSLLYSFSSRFLKASFSSFCCLQQLALEPKSVASHSSSLSFSLLSVITKVLWKCKPLLGSEVFSEETDWKPHHPIPEKVTDIVKSIQYSTKHAQKL